eukprot:COSAG05_NODE_14989_length_381_cov_0.918440_1_plen_36_part_10
MLLHLAQHHRVICEDSRPAAVRSIAISSTISSTSST